MKTTFWNLTSRLSNVVSAPRAHAFLCAGLLSAGLACAPSARAAADTVAGPMIIIIDTADDFKAIGSLTSVDNTAPPNGTTDAPWLPLAGVNWQFEIGHFSPPAPAAAYFAAPAPGGFAGVQLAIEGLGGGANGHQVAPHAGEVAPNPLPLQKSAAVNIPFVGGPVLRVAQNRRPHGRHEDIYAVRSLITAMPGVPNAGGPPPPPPGPPNLLTGPTEVLGAHRGRTNYSFPKFQSLVAGASAGSTVTFDASARQLRFNIGPITILDSQGGRTGGIEPRYLADPIRSTRWTVTALHLIGRDPDGRFRFGGGTNTLTDPAGKYSMVSIFGEYLIANTQTNWPLGNFGLFDNTDLLNSGDCASTFLKDFVDVNLFAHGVSREEWAGYQGIDFAFYTASDLVTASAAFTRTVTMPANYIICANGETPQLHSVGLLDVQAMAGNVVVSWPQSAGPVILESAPSLKPAATWTSVTSSPVLLNDRYLLQEAATEQSKFYRPKQ